MKPETSPCENCLFFQRENKHDSPYLHIYQSPEQLKENWKGTEFFRNEGKGYVYVCQCGNAVKIGQTGKPKTRLSTHQTNAKIYGENTVGKIAITSCFPYYKELERFLHVKFAENRRSIREEFFNVSFDEVVTVLKATLNESFLNYCFEGW